MLILLIVIVQRSFYVLSCFVTDNMFDYVYNVSYDDDLR